MVLDAVVAERPRIVVVDDDEAILSLYRDLLTEEGFQVTLRDRAPSGPGEVLSLRPNLLLLDLRLHGEDSGYRLLEQMKADRRTAAIPVVVSTAASALAEQVAGDLAAWDCRLILKPFDLDHLVAEIRAALAADANDVAC